MFWMFHLQKKSPPPPHHTYWIGPIASIYVVEKRKVLVSAENFFLKMFK
jgi:hypothetical protein